MERKKSIRVVCWLFLILIMLLPASWMGAYWINNIALRHYEKKVMSQAEINTDTMIAEVVSGCGNTSGTSNHTELYVGILVKTSLSEEEVREIYSQAAQIVKTEAGLVKTSVMSLLNLSFSQSSKETDEEEYYIIEYIAPAPCQSDIRGH